MLDINVNCNQFEILHEASISILNTQTESGWCVRNDVSSIVDSSLVSISFSRLHKVICLNEKSDFKRTVCTILKFS